MEPNQSIKVHSTCTPDFPSLPIARDEPTFSPAPLSIRLVSSFYSTAPPTFPRLDLKKLFDSRGSHPCFAADHMHGGILLLELLFVGRSHLSRAILFPCEIRSSYRILLNSLGRLVNVCAPHNLTKQLHSGLPTSRWSLMSISSGPKV